MGELENQNKSVVRQFGEALNSHNLDSLDDLVAADFVRHSQASPWANVRSLLEFKQYLAEDWRGVPDAKTTARFLVAEGDLVALYFTYEGTQTGQWGPLPPTGKRVEFDASGIFRISGGKISEFWITWDNFAILAQLGQLPPIAGVTVS
jgi:predicted ester cyclase